MDDSFTRSLYIGRDKTFEVARRREAVQKELKARREAKIREQNERIARAAQQKEQELKEKIRQRHEKELQRQRAVLDRRCAQLEQDKVKKAEILQKAHNAASRSAQIQRKSIYAFGSSTPRAPTYLETPRHYITKGFSASSDRLGSPGTSDDVTSRQTAAMRTPSRIMGSPAVMPKARNSGGTVPAAMTRSVFGRLTTTSRSTRPSATTASLTGGRGGGRRNTTSTNSSNNEGSSGGESSSSGAIRRTTPSIMTQSLYDGRHTTLVKKPPPPPKPTLPTVAKPATKNPTPSRSMRPLPSSETIAKAADAPSAPPVNRPPAIRPRKAIQKKQEAEEIVSKIADEAGVTIPAVVHATTENAAVVNLASASLQESNIQSEHSTSDNNFGEVIKTAVTQKINHQVVADSAGDNGSNIVAIEQVMKWDDDSQNYGVSLEPSTTASINSVADSEVESSTNSSTGNLLAAGAREEWDSGHESNCANDVDTAQMSLNKENVEEPFCMSTPKAGSVEENDGDTSTSKSEDTLDNYSTTTDSAVLKPPVVAAALDAEEKDRESRRQKLLEILQRTRNNGNLPTPNNSTASLSGMSGGLVDAPIRKTSGDLDASALAQDLLAQRRQKLQDMAAAQAMPNSNSASVASIMSASSIGSVSDKSTFNLNSDLNGVGSYGNENAVTPAVTTTSIYVQQGLNPILNGNGSENPITTTNSNIATDKHFRENTLVQLPGEVLSHVDIVRTHKQQQKFDDVPIAGDMLNHQQADPEDPRMERQRENGDSTRADSAELIQETQTITASH